MWKKREEKTVELELPRCETERYAGGHFKSCLFNLLDKDGSKVPAADVTRGDRKILFWLEVSKEPTEHILNELMERKEAFENYKREPSLYHKERRGSQGSDSWSAAAKHCRGFRAR